MLRAQRLKSQLLACDAQARAGETVGYIAASAGHRREAWKHWVTLSSGRHSEREFTTKYRGGGSVTFKDASRTTLQGYASHGPTR